MATVYLAEDLCRLSGDLPLPGDFPPALRWGPLWSPAVIGMPRQQTGVAEEGDQDRARGKTPDVRRMVETAAHLVDHVLPVRQWVLSVPKRIRPFLHHNPTIAGAVLHIFVRAIRTRLRQASPGAGPDAQIGSISFLHRFGSFLYAHFHFHVCVIDGVFCEDPKGSVQFYEATHLTVSDWDQLQQTVRHRVLRYLHGAPPEGGSRLARTTLTLLCPSSVRPRTARGYRVRYRRRRAYRLSSSPSRTGWRHRSVAHRLRVELRLPSAILACLGGGHCSVVYISTPRLDQSSGFNPADPEPVPEYAFDQSLPD
jgi:hypothetical protein